jgi:hypothetical protein
MIKNIGFVSTRFAGTDGVSLESSKWADVFEDNGFNCFWFAGELDRESDKAYLAPEAHFKHEQNLWINHHVFGDTVDALSARAPYSRPEGHLYIDPQVVVHKHDSDACRI